MSLYTPNRAQSLVLEAWWRGVDLKARGEDYRGAPQHIAAMGGWGVGKTALIPMIMQQQAEFLPGEHGMVLVRNLNNSNPALEECHAQLIDIGWRYSGSFRGNPGKNWISPTYSGRETRVFFLSYKRPSGASTSANSIEGPDLGWGIIEESNLFMDDEVARVAWGRVRSGFYPRLLMLGKPTMGAWWLRHAVEKGGWSASLPSILNRENLSDFRAWVNRMGPREVEENVWCRPQQPEGAVLSDFEPHHAPRGNLTPLDWTPDRIRGCRTVLTLDFGQRNPAALVLSYDPDLGAWVVWKAAHPDGVPLAAVINEIRMPGRGATESGLTNAPPLAFPSERVPMPNAIPVSRVVGDTAGTAAHSRGAFLASEFDDLALPVDQGGVGMRLRVGHDSATGERADIRAGLRLMNRLVLDAGGRRELLVWHRLWEAGARVAGRSLTKAIGGYRWGRTGAGDAPVKDGVHDHTMDALRYALVLVAWPSTAPLLGAASWRDGAPSVGRATPSWRRES